MRRAVDLVDVDDPAWPLVQGWLSAAANPVEVLPPPEEAARHAALEAIQISVRSPLGAVVHETGGLLVDHGWVRVLGAGHPRMPRSLPERSRRLVPLSELWSLQRSFRDESGEPDA